MLTESSTPAEPSSLADLVDVVIGVDTHTDTHTAAAVTTAGALLAVLTAPADPTGYRQLVAFADDHSNDHSNDHGRLRAWAIEGTNGYGAGLHEHLHRADELVIELDRPQRPARRAGAKSDPIDAERAARDALTRTRLAQPRTGADRAALADLLATRRSAVDAAADAQRAFHTQIVTAPESVRTQFRGRSTRAKLAIADKFDPDPTTDSGGGVQVFGAMRALHDLAKRIAFLRAEAAGQEKAILAIVRAWRPDLLELDGVGAVVAATVLTAWSHPGRFRHEAAFAMLTGTAPIPASSGKTVRHRLNRSGDRQLNRALHTIVICRMRSHPPTRDYVTRRRAEAKTDREIRRCLKRYIARQLFRQLEHSPLTS